MENLNIKNFIGCHEGWEEELSQPPYCLKISRDGPYIMFKYDQLNSDFNIPLVREARGIIFREDTWECVCFPFEKFGNYSESYCPEIDWSTASVQEKVDGSLIKFWNDDNKWHISTNGTIDAFKADTGNIKFPNFGELTLEAIKKTFPNTEDFFDALAIDSTYMFELVSPYNRVVIPYEEIKMYFLGWRHVDCFEEDDPFKSCMSTYFDVPKRYNLNTLKDVQNAANKLPWDEEGYVVCDGLFNRVKIKSPEYVKAHYVRSNNTINIERLVQIVLDGEQQEFLIYASDYSEELKDVENTMHKIAQDSVNTMLVSIYGSQIEFENRGDYAKLVAKFPNYMKDFLFHCYDERIFWDYSKNWNASKWVKAIEEYKVKQNN